MLSSNSRRQWLQNAVFAPLAGVLAVSAAAKALAANGQSTVNSDCNPLLSHRLRPLMAPEEQLLCDHYGGKVLLLVNTASKCGYTPQFEALETLHQRYARDGLQVLGFPSDDFRQELSTEQEVAQFCELNYGVSFPMFQKIHVKADNAHPLYQDLAKATGSFPNWNFNKYLVDRAGKPVAHYGSNVLPLGREMVSAIEALL